MGIFTAESINSNEPYEEDFNIAIHPNSKDKDCTVDLNDIAYKDVCPGNNLFRNTNSRKLLTRDLFGQLANINNFIIKRETNEVAHANNSLLEFDKHDQLISRLESEGRIFTILAIICFINNCIFSALIVSFGKFEKNVEVFPVEIPVRFKQPYLDAILKNGSVFSSHYSNTNFLTFEFKFSLPKIADYYFSFENNHEITYIHGRSQENHLFETFYNVHGLQRQKRHDFIKRDDGDPYHNDIGYNNSVSQVGEYLMIFGGGKNDASNLILSLVEQKYNYLSKYRNTTGIYLHTSCIGSYCMNFFKCHQIYSRLSMHTIKQQLCQTRWQHNNIRNIYL